MFTDKTILNAKPTQARYELGDDEVRGLRIQICPSGYRSFVFRYHFGNRGRKLSIGRYPEIGLKDARNLARKAYLDVAQGVDPAAEKKAARIKARTPADLDLIEKVVDQFLKRHVPHLAPATQRQVTRIMVKEIVPAWRGRKLSSITKAEAHHLLDAISDRGSPVSANRTLDWLKVMANWAAGRGLIETSPFAGITSPEPEVSRDRVLDDDELAAFWQAADNLEQPYGFFVRMLILTAQRRNEVSDMCWAEIDLERRIWTLPARRAKNGIEHRIPLSEAACSILASVQRHYGSDYVFSITGRNPIRGHQHIKSRLDELLPEMQSWVFHDLRRTAASGMARLGVQLPVVEKLLNHTSGSFRGIVAVYQKHDFAKEKAAAAETWARHIETIVNGEAVDNIVPIRHGR